MTQCCVVCAAIILFPKDNVHTYVEMRKNFHKKRDVEMNGEKTSLVPQSGHLWSVDVANR